MITEPPSPHNTSRPGTPISTALISSGQTPRQQIVGVQRFDLTSGATTGTQYQYASILGSYNRDGITQKLVHTATQTGGQWKATYQERADYTYWDFLFLKQAKQRWANYDAQLCPTATGGFTENYAYDYFGRLDARERLNCTNACPGACSCTPPGTLPDSSCASHSTTLVYYGYNGLRPEVLSERGGSRVLHATYILSNFGPGIRTDRNGTVLSLSDDTRIEPLMDAAFNNVAMAKASGVGYEQTDAFGDLINASGALADLGSFGWRGREGTINFRFRSTGGDPGLYRMGDRAMEAATGQFTQADRLILADATPLGANRYVYALADPVNWTDPAGYQGSEAEQLAVMGIIAILALAFLASFPPGLLQQSANSFAQAAQTTCRMAEETAEAAGEAAKDAFDSIQDAQQKVRKGAIVGKLIDDISKAKQKLEKYLKNYDPSDWD